MIQYYLYELHENCLIHECFDTFATMEEFILDIEQWDSHHGALLVKEENDVVIQQFLQTLIQDFDYTIRVMRSYANNPFTRHLLLTSPSFSGIFQDSDALMNLLIHQDQTVVSFLRHELSKLTRDDFETIHAYLAADLNAMKTSDYMYLHRNTLTYRLQRIYDKTGFDIRCYHHAMIIQQYLLITGN